MVIFISGNGNISWPDYRIHYEAPILQLLGREPDAEFLVGDFRGVDVLTMELLKTLTPNVRVFHVGEKPRYMPDSFKTFVPKWWRVGGFKNDQERDATAIDTCSHFLGIDFNSDAQRVSGTRKNIDRCLELGKVPLQTTV
ncbi:MAG TPA: hypothetical protein VHS96_18005 [Bacteroidia bacterium]|nr:hypothetical protein [Bacteroidia bacterium]